MLVLILVAVVRAHRDFDTSRPLTWVFGAGFFGLALATALLYVRMENQPSKKGKVVTAPG